MKIKPNFSILVIFTMAVFTGATALADCLTLDYVDIGDPVSEAGHTMVGWGPIEPATSGGGYGGIDNCRPIYAPEDGDDWATIDLDFGNDPTSCKVFTIHHLDGQTQDSFEVYIAGVLVYTYAGDDLTSEQWYELPLDVCFTGVQTVKFVSTAPQWSGWSTYGQMCFDILKVEQCPADCSMLDMVDIGDPGSEATHSLAGWGPIEPATSGGPYGGIDNCRAVYAPEDNNDWATVDLDFGDDPMMSKCVTIHHLEGIAIDSFELYINPVGLPAEKRLVYTFAGDAQTNEIWLQTSVMIPATGQQTLTFVSTAAQWSGWATYGQMCIDTIRVDECDPQKVLVDIGDPASEAGFNMVGWGPVEPQTSGGSYGGIDNCRPIYAPEDGNDWATIDFDFGCCEGLKCLVMEHLDGIGQDAFEVYMYPVGDPGSEQLIFTYPGDGQSVETWRTSSVLVSAVGRQTVKFVSTEPQWSGWATYGQMCFNTLRVVDYLPVMDAVTIGDPVSESGHTMAGWGPIEPATSGGNYGNIPQCRPIYAPEDNNDWATIEMNFGYCAEDTKCLTLYHLDGLAVDSFDVYIYAPGETRPATPAYSYTGDSMTGEVWYQTRFAVTEMGRQIIELVSTEAPWSMWSTYGQVCFSEIRVESSTPCGTTPMTSLTGVDLREMPVPGHFISIAPNPFNPKTEIRFALDADMQVELAIFDLRGHKVVTLVNERLLTGSYVFDWRGRDAAGRQMSNGVYFARLKIGDTYTQVRKVSMIK